MPIRKGGWWYYARTVEGKQYAVICRRAVRPDDAGAADERGRRAARRRGSAARRERAGGRQAVLRHRRLSVSPDGRLLAYSTDFSGDERFTLRIKDLATGETAPDEIPDTFYGSAWSLDGSALFYVTVDDAWRPYRVWRHMIGTPAARGRDRLRGGGREVPRRRRPDP